MLTHEQQHDMISHWFYTANKVSEIPFVYAGHELLETGIELTLFLLKPVAGNSVYSRVMKPWYEVRRDAERLGWRDIVKAIRPSG